MEPWFLKLKKVNIYIYRNKNFHWLRIFTFTVNLLLFYYTVMLLLHRPFIEFSSQTSGTNAGIVNGSVDLDALAADSRQACENAASNISVIVRQKQSLMSDPDSYSPLCLPTCFVYSMFQSSLIHLAIVIKNRDSLRRLRLLQRSIALLKQHQMLNSGQRAHNILVMLVAINGINIDNLLDHTKEEDSIPGLLTEDGLSHSSPPRSNNKELQFAHNSRGNIPLTQQHQQQQIQEQQIQPTAIIPSCEDNMPKSSWYQRMMNTSIVGGITADLHQGMNDANSTSLEQLLPYNHHPMHGQPHHHGHSRSDSNATLYHQPEADIHQQPYCSTYYDLNQPNMNAKRMDVYNDNHLFEEAGGNMRLIQTDTYHAPTTTTTTTTATIPTHASFTHRSSAPLPFTQTTATPLPPNGSPVPNSAHYSTVNYLPPSNYSWNDWGVYISHQSIPPPPTNNTSPEQHHLTR